MVTRKKPGNTVKISIGQQYHDELFQAPDVDSFSSQCSIAYEIKENRGPGKKTLKVISGIVKNSLPHLPGLVAEYGYNDADENGKKKICEFFAKEFCFITNGRHQPIGIRPEFQKLYLQSHSDRQFLGRAKQSVTRFLLDEQTSSDYGLLADTLENRLEDSPEDFEALGNRLWHLLNGPTRPTRVMSVRELADYASGKVTVPWISEERVIEDRIKRANAEVILEVKNTENGTVRTLKKEKVRGGNIAGKAKKGERSPLVSWLVAVFERANGSLILWRIVDTVVCACPYLVVSKLVDFGTTADSDLAIETNDNDQVSFLEGVASEDKSLDYMLYPVPDEYDENDTPEGLEKAINYVGINRPDLYEEVARAKNLGEFIMILEKAGFDFDEM